MNIGIYQIRNLKNSKCYVGSAAVSFLKRWSAHRRKLDTNQHENSKLQNAWNKYGANSFIFEILESVVRPIDISNLQWKELILAREQYYLDTILFASAGDSRFDELGYNICRVAGNCLNKKHSNKTKHKMSLAHSGRAYTLGHVLTEEHKKKISNATSGENNPMFGRQHSYITKLKIRRENNSQAKLTIDNIRQIILDLSMGLTQSCIANKLGISQSTVSQIKNGQRWRYIDG